MELFEIFSASEVVFRLFWRLVAPFEFLLRIDSSLFSSILALFFIVTIVEVLVRKVIQIGQIGLISDLEHAFTRK